MQKALIIILLIVISGCSVKRIPVRNAGMKNSTPEEIVGRVQRNNLSNEGFYIEKASLSFKINGETQKYLFSVKFSKPQNYLFSLKSFTGIEGARAIVTEDTILVNIRIGKKMLYGEPEDIEKKTGLFVEMIGILLGDLVVLDNEYKIISGNSKSEIIVNQRYGDKVIRSVVDSELEKVSNVSVSSTPLMSGVIEDSIVIKFSKYIKKEKIFPARIEIKDLKRNIIGKIRIEKYEFPWEGVVEFIPGKEYKIEKIK